MQPNSSDTASPHAATMAPTNHSKSETPMLPADCAITPGIAKIPDPTTRDMMRMYAELQESVRRVEDGSGKVLSSANGVLGVLGVLSVVGYGDSNVIVLIFS